LVRRTVEIVPHVVRAIPQQLSISSRAASTRRGRVAFSVHFVTFGQNNKLADTAQRNWTPMSFRGYFVPDPKYGKSVMELGVPTGPMRVRRFVAVQRYIRRHTEADSQPAARYRH
jgi:hypothetical protein